jgi:RND family efflux transporter MFP subunit
MKKKIFYAVVIVVLGLLGWQIYAMMSASGRPKTMQQGKGPVAVEVREVEKRTLKDIGLFTGSLYPKSQFIAAPKVAGRLQKLLVKIGDSVKKEQLIATLENDEYVQQVDQARAELDVARANFEESRSSLEIARRELERARTLREKKIASESELDAAEAQFKAQDAKHKVSVAQVAQKEAALKAAQVRLSYTQIRASWEEGDESRVVGERFVDEGAMLAPNAFIVSVLDISTMIAVIHVIERDYAKIRTGFEGRVSTDAFPERTFPARIVRIAPLLKETSRQARVEMELPNPDNLLRPGMFIRVEIEFASHADATVVPLNALVKRNGQQGVFIADLQEMKAKFLPVRPGMAKDEWAQILEPELSGSVITLGHHLLEEGSSIMIPVAKPGAAGSEGKGQRKTGIKPSGDRK